MLGMVRGACLRAPALLAALALAGLVPLTTWAQEDAGGPAPVGAAKPAAAEEPEDDGAPADMKPGVIEHGQAIEALRRGENRRAALFAWASISNSTPSAEKYESAQFALAEALTRLGLEQAGAEYFFEVARHRRTPALLPRALAGLDKLARQGLVSEDTLMRGVMVEADLGDLPKDTADFVHYYQGLADLRAGLGRWVKSDFAGITTDGYYANQARYVKAVAKVRAKDTDGALKLVDELLSKKPDPLTEARARLVRARLLYETGKHEDALAEYLKVKKTDYTARGGILLERAWSRYKMGQQHDSMGLLYSLLAPSNRALFLPEQYILRGLIYQRFCHYRAAKAAVAEFRVRYSKAITEVRLGRPPHEVDVVRRAALDRPEVLPYHRIYRAVVEERERLLDMKSDLARGKLFDHLKKVYDSLEIQAGRALGLALKRGARGAAEMLLEAEEQANLLEYEVGVAIFRRISDAGGRGISRAPAEKVPLGGRRIYYRFDGEFWTDELPDMRFLIQNRCVE